MLKFLWLFKAMRMMDITFQHSGAIKGPFSCWLEIRAGHGINAKQDGRRQFLEDP